MKKEKISVNTGNDEYKLIRRILLGEKELYEILIRRYNPMLYRISKSILKDSVEAEDAMQETYLKAYENLGKFEFRSGFSTWIVRILINEATARLKLKARIMLIEEDTDFENYSNDLTDNQTPEQNIMNHELNNLLENALCKIPYKYRIVFVLREIEGMNILETAKSLDITGENVKVRLHRAKEMLQSTLFNFYYETELFPFTATKCDKMVRSVFEKLGK